jgi:hypothetical protein
VCVTVAEKAGTVTGVGEAQRGYGRNRLRSGTPARINKRRSGAADPIREPAHLTPRPPRGDASNPYGDPVSAQARSGENLALAFPTCAKIGQSNWPPAGRKERHESAKQAER